jgi:hypothetical protein
MSQPPRASRPRLPAFTPVPVRSRSDGWVPWRQAEFIGVLAETGSVSTAAKYVGMARETAYRLRRKPGAESFARAWDIAMRIACDRLGRAAPAIPELGLPHLPPKVTGDELWRRIVDGRWRPVLRRGKYVGSLQEPDNSALLSHLAQLDRSFRATRKELRREARSQMHKSADLRQTPQEPSEPTSRWACPGSAGRARP